MTRAAAIVAALALAACAQPPVPSCTAPLKPALEIDLYFGRDKPGGGEVSEAEWAAFVAEVQRVFDRLAANALMHGVALADVRKAVVRRFPYCVYYRPHADRVEVLAVFHTSRDPSLWQGRV